MPTQEPDKKPSILGTIIATAVVTGFLVAFVFKLIDEEEWHKFATEHGCKLVASGTFESNDPIPGVVHSKYARPWKCADGSVVYR